MQCIYMYVAYTCRSLYLIPVSHIPSRAACADKLLRFFFSPPSPSRLSSAPSARARVRPARQDLPGIGNWGLRNGEPRFEKGRIPPRVSALHRDGGGLVVWRG
jgi:hypothetical protein